MVRTVGTEAEFNFTAQNIPTLATMDLVDGLSRYRVWTRFALHDIRQRFRRSLLGPFWLTLNMGVMVGVLALVFNGFFQRDIGEALPYVATGLIFWGLLTSCITEGTTIFILNESFIRNVPIPISLHFFRMIARNLIVWFFNMAIYAVVFVAFRHAINADYLLFFPGFFLFVLNACWIAFAVAIVSTRFRDVPQIVLNLVQVVFFLTPVFWLASALPGRPAFITWNPFFHLLELVREPLLGRAPAASSWIVASVMAVLGTAFAVQLYRRTFSRIPYWV